MDKKWKRRVGRLDMQTPPPKLKKTRYIDDNGIILETIHDGTFSPPEQTPPEYLSFEADKDNTSIVITSTRATAPNIEYSTEGRKFSVLPHTTSNSTHTFDTITLDNKGDKVYLRGNNKTLGSSTSATTFKINGGVIASGVLTTLLDKKGKKTQLPNYAFNSLFEEATSGFGCYMKGVPSLGNITKIGNYSCRHMYLNSVVIAEEAADMSKVTYIGEGGCLNMYYHTYNIKKAADMDNVETIGDGGCSGMYATITQMQDAASMKKVSSFGTDCIKSMYMLCSNLTLIDNGELTFEFPELPITDASGKIYSTPQDVVDAMTYNPWA